MVVIVVVISNVMSDVFWRH